jgi:hypothetical protein
VDVVASSAKDIETDGFADDARDRFGFEFARVLAIRAIIAAVQQLVGALVH